MSDYQRRLPIYLLVDCSGSMRGTRIEEAKRGILSLVSELKNNPQALETVYISVITFSNTVEQVSPLTELVKFKEPELVPNGGTRYYAYSLQAKYMVDFKGNQCC